MVTEWKKGRAQPTGEQALHMQELIKTKPKSKKAGFEALTLGKEGSVRQGPLSATFLLWRGGRNGNF